jgi:hypothetical protein
VGWVEIVETLKRVGSVSMPDGVEVYFTTKMNGLTYGAPMIRVQCRNGYFDWNMERVPSNRDLIDWRLRLDQFISAGGH